MNSIRRLAMPLAAALLAGCASSASSPGYTLGEIAGDWSLEVLDDRDVTDPKPRMRIDAARQRIGGFDGCGPLEGEVAIVQSRLQASRMNPTVACEGRAQDIRDAFRLVLGTGGRMLPVTREGKPLLVLEGVGHTMLFARP
jgi:heat shock protein HslJ